MHRASARTPDDSHALHTTCPPEPPYDRQAHIADQRASQLHAGQLYFKNELLERELTLIKHNAIEAIKGHEAVWQQGADPLPYPVAVWQGVRSYLRWIPEGAAAEAKKEGAGAAASVSFK